MDKRKIEVTKSPDGKTTNTRNKFGSDYKKKSILLRTSTVVDNSTDIEQMFESHNAGYDPVKLIESIENRIIQFLKDNNLPTKDFKKGVPRIEGGSGDFTFKSLPLLLKEDYHDVIGAAQASSCLFEIVCCKDDLRRGDFKAGMAHALRLVDAYNRFFFATIESTVSRGTFRKGGLLAHKRKAKLTEVQYAYSFEKYESLNMNEDKTRELTNAEKWRKIIKYIKNEYDVTISDRNLRGKYKVWKSR